jgi:hypothetical protein
VRELLHRHLKFFVFFSLAAVGLRLLFVYKLSYIGGDSFIYGDTAKNMLLHGVYGLTDTSGVVHPTYIRLPGYSIFLAIMFKIFGMEHYRSAMITQVFIDLGTAFVVSALTFELVGSRASAENLSQPALKDGSRAERPALAAFLLTAFCPFFIIYVATPLTETWSIFLTALTLYLGIKGLRALFQRSQSYWKWWLGCGIALGLDLYLRPDAGILLAMAGAVLFPLLFKFPRSAFAAGMITLMTVVLLLTPWTIRNWRTMHRFQPLAPRYANDPDDFVALGFTRWLKTWVVDLISTSNVEWRVPGEKIDVDDLPARACDNQPERDQTESVIDDYNQELDVSPEIDAEFAQLAEQRIRRHPLRYYLWLPALRVTEMWLRPRVEILPIDLDWWKIEENGMDSWIAIALGGWNIILLLLAIIGTIRNRPPTWGLNEATLIFALLIGFLLMRSLFLATIENPEPRYMLECYPVVLAFAGAAFVRKGSNKVIEKT